MNERSPFHVAAELRTVSARAVGVFSFKAPTGSVGSKAQAKALAEAVVGFGGSNRRGAKYSALPT